MTGRVCPLVLEDPAGRWGTIGSGTRRLVWLTELAEGRDVVLVEDVLGCGRDDTTVEVGFA